MIEQEGYRPDKPMDTSKPPKDTGTGRNETHPHDLIEKGRKYDELKALIKKVQPEIERSINLTPSGHFRNILTNLNIELLQALNPKT